MNIHRYIHLYIQEILEVKLWRDARWAVLFSVQHISKHNIYILTCVNMYVHMHIQMYAMQYAPLA